MFGAYPTMQPEIDILLRLLAATLLGGILGWERQAAGKAAGLRTHILVAAGAALFVGLGELLVMNFSAFGDLQRIDPNRIIEAVVAGVSFLGAGTIFVVPRDQIVHGLTTAASLWATAGVGMAAGLGRYVLAGGATVLFFLVLHCLLWLEPNPDQSDPARGSKPPSH